MELLTVGWG